LIGLLVASPAASWALKEGHPEELLAAALCVGGMLLVLRGRISSGAILLGLAVASKQWAILAVDERAAIKALPQLLPADATARRSFSDLVQTMAATAKLKAQAGIAPGLCAVLVGLAAANAWRQRARR